MIKTQYYLPVLLLLVSILLYSCKKEQELPLIDYDKRVNTWVLDKFYKNGANNTPNLTLTDLNYKIEDGGFYGFTFWYTDAAGEKQDSINSTYGIYEERNEIFLNYSADSIHISNEFVLSATMIFGVSKLDENNFWFEYEELGNLFELRFVPE